VGGDTQVLLAAYAQWGAQCLHRLDGMFAFAIHDRDAHGASLFLARDRLGIKPLYYCMRDGDFLFASELKALLASERVARTLDPSSLGHYLSLGAMAQPATAIVGVHMLAPGHYLHVTCGESPIPRRYWELADAAPWNDSSMQRLDREEASAQVRRLLDDATRRHLVADVDVGAFLSGGMDSSAIVALMSPLHSAPIKTFSVGFENSGDVDERIWARRVAERFETDHSEVVVTGDQVAAQFDRIISSLDQPSLDGTNTWLVAQAAGVSVKVALSGVGGDELFAGYEHFRSLLMAERYAPCMAWLTPRLRTALTRILPRRVRAGSALLGLSREQRFQSLRNLDVGGEFASERLRTHRAHHALAGVYAPWMRADMDTLRQTSYLEVRGYLLNTLLRDIDAMAMAHSLEVRPLLLDHHLVEYVFALPSRLKVAAHVNKPLLADAVRDLLPQELLRRRKRGFELPLLQWLNGPLRARASAAFNTEQARSVFAPRFLRNLTTQLRDGQCNSIGAWAWFCLLEWMQAQRCTLEL
ncbi:MAG: asparagine synthase (glutamine-hydrolyzing), partial [Gammaproteobacteria bacterium]